MNRHAYLIMAHDEPEMLQSLIDCIDDLRNDIFIHIDLKADISLFEKILAQKSNLYYCNRVDVRWGDISQIRAELELFSMALNRSKYSYLHLLSGHDLPIKSQDYIHEYFNTLPNGCNLIGTATSISNEIDLRRKTEYRWFFCNRQKNGGRIITGLLRRYRNSLISIQKILKIKRYWGEITPVKGVNWVSITSECAQYILSKETWIMGMFKHISCGDEIFIQSLVYNSPFKATLFRPTEDFGGCMREIDWQRGAPYTWRKEDFNYLINSERLFARKFSYTVDSEIIKLIINKIKNP